MCQFQLHYISLYNNELVKGHFFVLFTDIIITVPYAPGARLWCKCMKVPRRQEWIRGRLLVLGAK